MFGDTEGVELAKKVGEICAGDVLSVSGEWEEVKESLSCHLCNRRKCWWFYDTMSPPRGASREGQIQSRIRKWGC